MVFYPTKDSSPSKIHLQLQRLQASSGLVPFSRVKAHAVALKDLRTLRKSWNFAYYASCTALMERGIYLTILQVGEYNKCSVALGYAVTSTGDRKHYTSDHRAG